MNIPLDGGQDDLPLGDLLAALGQDVLLDDLKSLAGGVGGVDELGQEDLALLIPLAHRVQSGDELLIDDVQRLCCLQQRTGQLGTFRLQPPCYCRLQIHLGGWGRGGWGRGGVGEAGDIGGAVLVLSGEHFERGDGVHDGCLVGVDDGQIQAAVKGLDEEIGGDVHPFRQAEADVGHAQHGVQSQLLGHPTDGFQGLLRLVLLGGDGEGQAVDDDVLLGDAMSPRGVQNPLRHVKPLLRRFRQAILVHGQTHHGGAVLLHDGQDGLQNLRLAVDRVDDGTAAAGAQASLDDLRISGVNLQGQGDHRLDGLHHIGHHGHLVDARQAYVHVQNVRTCVLLSHGLVQDIVQIVFPQRLLEPLFTGGIDALAHHPHAGELCHLRGRADPVALGGTGHFRRFRTDGVAQLLDELRRRAAAAAQDADAQLGEGHHLPGKLRRCDGVLIGLGVGQPGVGLDHQGQVRPLAQLFRQRQNLSRPQGAVEPDGVHAQPLQGHGHGGDGGAGEGAAVALEAHGG